MLSEDRTLFIENLFVTENCRRKGIGTEVYKLIESAARKSGHTHIGLSIYSRLKDPTAAIAFGKSLGFRIASFDSMHTGMSKTLLGVVPSPEVSESPGVGA
jgi:GNAT superfamily N-acetyltransferase